MLHFRLNTERQVHLMLCWQLGIWWRALFSSFVALAFIPSCPLDISCIKLHCYTHYLDSGVYQHRKSKHSSDQRSQILSVDIRK